MSTPQFPEYDPCLTREQALNGILSSIAMEELALSHIINAEGEKLQYLLKEPSTCPRSTDDLLAVNKSVTSLMNVAIQTQMLLKSKMESVLDAMPAPPPCPPPCRPHCPSPCPPPCPSPSRPPGPPPCERPCRPAREPFATLVMENYCWQPNRALPLRPAYPLRPCGENTVNHARILLPPGGRFAVDICLSVRDLHAALTVKIDACPKNAAVDPGAFYFSPDCGAGSLFGSAAVTTPCGRDTQICFVLLSNRNLELCRAQVDICRL